MSTNTNPKEIHAFLGIQKLTDTNLSPVLSASVKGLTDNAAAFNKLPVDLAVYTLAVAAFIAAIITAADGGKTAIAQKNKLRNAAIKRYKQLAHYVEANCNDDLDTFLLSGFQANASRKTMTAPLQPGIRLPDLFSGRCSGCDGYSNCVRGCASAAPSIEML